MCDGCTYAKMNIKKRSTMKLIIHDLSAEQWEKTAPEYEGWTVIADHGNILPCCGCFGCWNKDPGRCVLKDGFENMGYLIHHAEEVTVISRYTYGGFSGFVKNVFDRSLGYVLPHFEIVGGESHHQKRYDETRAFTFIFYGHDLSEEEKLSARRYVRAVTANMRTRIKAVIFREVEEEPAAARKQQEENGGRILLLNASMRWKDGNSAKLAAVLAEKLEQECDTVPLVKYRQNMSELLPVMEEASAVVLCMPLYVDGLPSQLIRFMELCEREYRGAPKRIYVLANMGLYESRQLVNLFEAVRQWCGAMGFVYCGGLGVSAGELVGALLDVIRPGIWPTRPIVNGLCKLAGAIRTNSCTEDTYTGPDGFPRSLYIAIANSGWKRMAVKNGIRPQDLFRRL